MQRWTHYLLSYGDNVRVRRAEHAPLKVDLTTVIGTGQGRRRRSDARVGRDTAPPQDVSASAPSQDVSSLAKLEAIQRKKSPWRRHQSKAHERPGRCLWEHCPNLYKDTAEEQRGYHTFNHSEQCSAKEGEIMYFCNDVKGKAEGETNKWVVCLCHEAYHKKYCDYPK